MARVKSQTNRLLLGALFLMLPVGLLSGCVDSDTTPAAEAAQTPTNVAAAVDGADDGAQDDDGQDDDGQAETGADDVEASTGDPSDASHPGDTAESTASPERTLADDDVASSIAEEAGFQFEDEQGNLVAIYGIAAWPESFDGLTTDARAVFPFVGDISRVNGAETALVALDVAMCAAGIDGQGSGTAEFFVHDSPDAALSAEPALNRSVLTPRPLVQPGFQLPTTAQCSRGWLPMFWSGPDTPTVARYVLTTRSSASAEPERHVYQWDIDGDILDPDDAEVAVEVFDAGQTVTFNEGRLADATVTVEGWAELVGVASEFEGTRTVAVSIEICPGSNRLPEFGLGVDGWNLIAPIAGQDLVAALQAPATNDGDASLRCVDGWLNFAVPFGAVPTSFFASDGADAMVGYAEWSLVSAAIAAPQ